MNIEVASFLVGSLLVIIAVVGGGVEVKELKIPRIAALTRVSSLAVGLVFVLFGIFWSVHGQMVLHPSGDAPIATNFDAAPAAPSATATAPAETGEAVSTAVPASSNTGAGESDPLAQAAAPSQEFSGFQGQSELAWVIDHVKYIAVIAASDQRAELVVSYLDEEGNTVRVREDMALQPTTDGFQYAGSNPRDAETGEAFPDYTPDTITITQADGGWTYAQACDDQNGCVAVTITT